MIKPTVYCDVCGVARKDANHWFVLHLMDGPDGDTIILHRWSQGAAEIEGVLHLCGEAHAQKKVNEFLSKPVVKEELVTR